jgi:hypothetical protein
MLYVYPPKPLGVGRRYLSPVVPQGGHKSMLYASLRTRDTDTVTVLMRKGPRNS